MASRPLIAVALVAWSAMAGPAEAHALLRSSQPAAGARVDGTRIEFTLRYNSRVDAKRSRMVLIHPGGEASVLPAQPGDAADMLRTEADHLPPGDYRLHWEVLSVDGHVSGGDLPFVVMAR